MAIDICLLGSRLERESFGSLPVLVPRPQKELRRLYGDWHKLLQGAKPGTQVNSSGIMNNKVSTISWHHCSEAGLQPCS